MVKEKLVKNEYFRDLNDISLLIAQNLDVLLVFIEVYLEKGAIFEIIVERLFKIQKLMMRPRIKHRLKTLLKWGLKLFLLQMNKSNLKGH